MQQPDFTKRVSYGKKIKGQAELQLRMRFSISLQHFIKMLILMPPSFKIIHKVKVCAPSTLRSIVRPKIKLSTGFWCGQRTSYVYIFKFTGFHIFLSAGGREQPLSQCANIVMTHPPPFQNLKGMSYYLKRKTHFDSSWTCYCTNCYQNIVYT